MSEQQLSLDGQYAPTRYLVVMTTLRGLFYKCSSLTDGIAGWSSDPTAAHVTEYMSLGAAKNAAAKQWEMLNLIFDPMCIEVIRTTGQPVWEAGSVTGRSYFQGSDQVK